MHRILSNAFFIYVKKMTLLSQSIGHKIANICAMDTNQLALSSSDTELSNHTCIMLVWHLAVEIWVFEIYLTEKLHFFQTFNYHIFFPQYNEHTIMLSQTVAVIYMTIMQKWRIKKSVNISTYAKFYVTVFLPKFTFM